jgi:hypothetical protein
LFKAPAHVFWSPLTQVQFSFGTPLQLSSLFLSQVSAPLGLMLHGPQVPLP